MKYPKLFLYFILINIIILLTCCGDDGSPLDNDANAVTAAKNALTIGFSPENSYDNVTKNITLPANGINDTAITWHSYNQEIISNEGFVTTPPFYITQKEYNTVILRADISRNTETTNKYFTLRVISHGIKKSFKVGNAYFKMILAPGNKTIPVNTNDTSVSTVEHSFWIGETEVTYELWYNIYIWATTDTGAGTREDGGVLYDFEIVLGANTGAEPNVGSAGDPWSDPVSQQPVTDISWVDANIWCNALTEYCNSHLGTDFSCAYTSDSNYINPIRDVDFEFAMNNNYQKGTSFDPYKNPNANGFRLSMDNEWDLAARYRGYDITNSVISVIESIDFSTPADHLFWTKGNSVSGASKAYDDLETDSSTYAVFDSTTTADVKSKRPNALGLYDLSGNVEEWVYDFGPEWNGEWRSIRGGDYRYPGEFAQLGLRTSSEWGYQSTIDRGFRFARTAE